MLNFIVCFFFFLYVLDGVYAMEISFLYKQTPGWVFIKRHIFTLKAAVNASWKHQRNVVNHFMIFSFNSHIIVLRLPCPVWVWLERYMMYISHTGIARAVSQCPTYRRLTKPSEKSLIVKVCETVKNMSWIWRRDRVFIFPSSPHNTLTPKKDITN